MEYPKGTKFNSWVVFTETQKGKFVHVIRRRVIFESGQTKYERLPTKRYRSMRDDLEELKKFIVRLNQEVPVEQRTIETIEIRHAYIDEKLLDTYKEFLKAQIPSNLKDRYIYEFNTLKKYFLKFFINTLGIPDPIQWHKIHKTEWANYLLENKEVPRSMRSKKEITSAANRFMAWLHDRRPEEVPPLRFDPISKAKAKEVEADREREGDTHIPLFIKDDDWKIIEKALPDHLRSVVLLAYNYGLRRSETLGLTVQDVRHGFLSVERQLVAYTDKKPKCGSLKGKEKRKVPHWCGTPDEVHSLISEIVLMSPDTLTAKWTEFIEKLKLDYTFHDLRHTWITKMIRLKEHRDVQLAAGHKNITTTMDYLHDDRTMEERVFVPNKVKKVS